MLLHKLPVFATAGRAYGFLVREFATILRLSWFVIFLVLVVQYFATTALYATMREAIEAHDPAALTAVATMLSPWQVFNVVTTVLGSAIVAVALHRVIGDRQPDRYIRPEFREEFFRPDDDVRCASGNVDLVKALLAGRDILRPE